MKLSEISIQRPVLATMMSLGLVLFGVIGLSRLPVRELPDVDPPIVNVSTVYPGANAEVVETQVTEPLEEMLSSIEGIKTLTSQSREQFSNVTIEFDLSRSVDIAAQDVRDRVSRVRGKLPDEIDEPVIAKQDADARPSLWIALYSDRYSTLELTTLGENVIKDRLQTVRGVSSVILGGSKRFAIRIWLDSEKMAAHGVTVLDVDEALRAQSVELPSGKVENLQRELSIETKGQLKTPEGYNDLVIKQNGARFVRLKDIGNAVIGVEDVQSAARFNSQPAVGLGVIKQSKANTVAVARGIKEEMERIKPLLPDGVNVSIPYDESIYVEHSIEEVWQTLGIAFALVVLAIFIFLHNFRSTLIPSVTIPVSIISTFAVLYYFGYSINIVTMLAFVLAIGLVVDDAIIVLENIHRHIEEGMAPMEAAVTGMREIGFAVITTTIALVAVFLPLMFQTSETGRLFIEFAVAVCFAVIISSFVALTLAPMMCSRILKPVEKDGRHGIFDWFESLLSGVTKLYVRTLGWALRHRLIVLILALCTVAGAMHFYGRLDHEFLPEEDKGRLFCVVIAPEGSTSEYTDRMVRKMERIIAATPEVDGYFSAVALARGGPGRSSEGLAFIRLKEGPRRHVRQIVNDPGGLRNQFFQQIEGAIVVPIIPKSIGRGFSQPFELVLQHQDLGELNQYANKLSDRLRTEGFLINVRSSFELNRPQMRVHVNRDRAAALGISIRDVSRTLQILFGGLDLNKVNLLGKQYDVIAQLDRQSRLTPADLDKVYVRGTTNDLVQLSNIVDYDFGGGPGVIDHYNRFRSATIEATPAGMTLGTAIDRVEAILREDLPPEFRYEWAGEAKSLLEAGSDLKYVFILALLVIYMVLASQFESLIHPFTILLTVPLALFGALGALALMNHLDIVIAALTPSSPWYGRLPRIPSMGINLFSQIGMILLIGLVTKNAILLIDFANKQVALGKEPAEAMLIAARIRLRPILMTAVSTVAGIMPIAVGFGAGAESRRPLGVAAEGGLIVSTFLTLYVIPVVYVLLSRKKRATPAVARGKPLLLVGLCLMVNGCVQGPDYIRPVVEPPPQWKASTTSEIWKAADPSVQRSGEAWWTIFDDPTLNRLQLQASEQNQNLAAAMTNVTRARALTRVAEARFYPSAVFNPEYERSRRTKNSLNATAASSKSFTSDRFSLPIDLIYQTDFWGATRRAFEVSLADAEGSVAGFDAVALALSADIARTYFALAQLHRDLDILQQTVDVRARVLTLVRRRVEGGITNQLDLNVATTELARVKTGRFALLRQRAELENILAVLCGQVASGFTVSPTSMAGEPPAIPLTLPSTLLERRPDILQAERLVMAANARIGIAETAFFPTIRLNAATGLESVTRQNLFEWESRVWSLGPTVSLPLFRRALNNANLEAAMAEYDRTVADYRQRVLEAFGDVERIMADVALILQQREAQDELVASTRRTAELSMERYANGLVTFLEVADAERSRLDAELEATRLLGEQFSATINLIQALGGAW